MLASARSARHGRTAERAAFKSHIDFDRRITARIKNFARDYCLDAGLCHKMIYPVEIKERLSCVAFRIPQSALQFSLAMLASAGTLAHESFRTPGCDRAGEWLLRCDWRRAGAPSGRSACPGNQERLDQHSHAGRTFRRARKTGEAELVRPISRPDADDLS